MDLLHESQVSKGVAPTASFSQVSPYMKRVIKSHTHGVGLGRPLSVARALAMDDPRNAVVAAASKEILCRDVHPSLIGNFTEKRLMQCLNARLRRRRRRGNLKSTHCMKRPRF